MPIPQGSSEEPVQSSSWADQMENLDASEVTPGNLPDDQVTVEGDTKTVVCYEEQDGKVKKITRVYRVERLKVPKAVARRKQLPKFGDAERDGPGPNRSTTQIADEVFLALTTNKEALEQQDDDAIKKLQQAKGMVTCRICKGDHWTSRCPYKDTLGATAVKEQEEQKAATTNVEPVAAAGRVGGGSGKYVPPAQREGRRAGETMGTRMREDDHTTVRVTNLSEDAQEADLRELFNHFGRIRRVFLAKDKITQQSKGFAFISYEDSTDAQNAIDNLNGFGYDHLILKVEWAKPSKPQ